MQYQWYWTDKACMVVDNHYFRYSNRSFQFHKPAIGSQNVIKYYKHILWTFFCQFFYILANNRHFVQNWADILMSDDCAMFIRENIIIYWDNVRWMCRWHLLWKKIFIMLHMIYTYVNINKYVRCLYSTVGLILTIMEIYRPDLIS